MDPVSNASNDIDSFVSALSPEEKASLGSGAAFWVTKRTAGLPAVVMEDGPHGVRHQPGDVDHMGIAPSDPATCFPPATALAQTWDPELVERVGEALGTEARSFGTDVLLGPGVNIKRDPRCGRNFEYFSEDPLLSGRMGAAWVRGLQRRGAGASVKHFAANNQEFERMRYSSDIDERPLREIYLRSFEHVVREARPWTVMAAYNRLNGVPATENHWLLTEVLRDEWGFDGLVVSDWGAVGDRVRAVRGGLDLQMPGGDAASDQEVVDAVRRGELDESVVTERARRAVQLAWRVDEARRARPDAAFDVDRHHRLAREVAGRAVVLLQNDGGVLPLSPEGGSIAVIGPFAVEPRIQGGGSSRVVPTKVDVAVDEIRAIAGSAAIAVADGYRYDGGDAERLRAEAARCAAGADVAVVFLGLTAAEEAEGTDRPGIDLPVHQLELLAAVAAVQPRTVAVVVHGGVVRLHEVAARVPAVLDGSLLGQAGGGAIADVLFGRVNPAGRLAETVPLRLEDAPSFPTYPGDQLHVRYGEGLFVGYRGYDRMKRDVAFPFGHGLSYTTFEYRDLHVGTTDDGIDVTVTVANTGTRGGHEVVQVYLAKDGGVQRPPVELKAFRSVRLAPGESSAVRLSIPREDLAHWDIALHRWVVEGGTYTVHAGASSRDLRLSQEVDVAADAVRRPFTEDSTIGELLVHPVGARALAQVMRHGAGQAQNTASQELGIDAQESGLRIPVGRVRSLSGGAALPKAELERLLEAVNAELGD
ncbi:glycoside hydrolase family 3 C-terminal domain-containing protein [Streptomyces sp. Li-HN-5-11]|uniref:glycoside hydrolase family 3 C-terminal domain-containing protein n=1 Tax=Streptomyces sp. Li-HN-5-11 TaxID=3075432 RepID=UPI0028A92E4D|nr:glycoside hydrolase family 3 C-terminal domain-containing protein [Streptomyces sp. Li-HN-5-11]WNM31938.1 glycoside hydrolase family 3 C-terminal domain-containing protein [Streptomyces sp. Li-HN-5-11]